MMEPKMDARRARGYTTAYWCSQEKWRQIWLKEKPVTLDDQNYGQYLITVNMVRGHAAGWGDGVKWERRRQNKKRK